MPRIHISADAIDSVANAGALFNAGEAATFDLPFSYRESTRTITVQTGATTEPTIVLEADSTRDLPAGTILADNIALYANSAGSFLLVSPAGGDFAASVTGIQRLAGEELAARNADREAQVSRAFNNTGTYYVQLPNGTVRTLSFTGTPQAGTSNNPGNFQINGYGTATTSGAINTLLRSDFPGVGIDQVNNTNNSRIRIWSHRDIERTYSDSAALFTHGVVTRVVR